MGNSDIKAAAPAVAPAADVADGYTEKLNLSKYGLKLQRGLESYVPGSDAEKRLVRKLDLYMMPSLWFMYILAYIDRQNIVSSLTTSLPAQLSQCN
jgi:hypothetical protein